MKGIIIAALLAAALSLSGCTITAPYNRREMTGFWSQCIEAEAWGMTGVTQFGPINLGYVSWKRNVDCADSMP